MDAKDSDPAGSNHGSASGESAEEELVRFFAETSAEESRTQPRVPVKGSIMSFFKPASTAAPSGENQPPTKLAKQTETGNLVAESLANTSVSVAQQQALVDTVTWPCETCTFVNNRTKRQGGWLACEMCGTPYIQDISIENEIQNEFRTRARSPVGVKPSQEPIVIDIDSDEKPKSRARASETVVIDTNALETIVIDADSTNSTSEHSVVIDVDVPDNRGIVTPFSKVKKARGEESKSSAEGPKSDCVLNFSVSVNSGRVLFHSASRGDPLCHGFDIDQVLTGKTTDSLLNATVKRTNGRPATPVDIQFCNASVLKGQ